MWTRQIFTALCWIHLFLTEAAGTISRTFLWSRFYDTDHSVVITTDASPYCIGGFVSVNGVVTEYFADHISPTGCKILQREHGSHEGQQAFEALALLVAFRLWKPLLLHFRACITFRADNVGVLTVIAVGKGKGHSLETVARELALDLAACDYLPYTAAHLPGVANETADSWSRRYDPMKQPWTTPPMLARASAISPAVRSDT